MAMAAGISSQGQTINDFLFYYKPRRTIINLPNTITPAITADNFTRDSLYITHHLLHTIYAFVIPVFIGLLQIQSQGNTTSSLFQLHPVTTAACVLCIFGYHLAFMASLRFPSYPTQSSVAMAVCGSLSLASLITLLLPDSWWHVRYIVYSLLAVVELHQLLKVLYHKYLIIFIGSFISPWPSSPQRHLLPLSNMDLMPLSNMDLR